MAAKSRKRKKPGPPARYSYRPTLTIRLQEPVYKAIKAAAAAHGKSLSEEIEGRLGRDLSWEKTKGDIDQLHAEARAAVDASRVRALRIAGLQILRETTGRPTRVIIDFLSMIAEADGIAKGLRPGFMPDNAPPVEPPRPMTEQEERQALDEINKLMGDAKTDDKSAA